MFKSNLVIDINAIGGLVASASYRPKEVHEDKMNVTLKQMKVDETWYHEWKIYTMIAHTCRELADSGFSGRVSIIVPDRCHLRCIAMMKNLLSEEFDFNKMILQWMIDPKFEVIGKDNKKYNPWIVTLSQFADSYNALLENDAIVNWVNARKLYKWKLTGHTEGLANGDMLFFKNGVCEEHDIVCENKYLNGQQEVTITVERYNGQEHRVYFVKRKISVDENGEPKGETAIALKNALMLRTENAKQFPRIKVAKDIKVVETTGNSLF